MPRKKAPSVQISATVPVQAADRLNRLADALSVTVPDLIRFMVATQLVQWEAMYLHPEKFVDVAGKAGGSAADAMVDHLASEVSDLVGGDRPKQDAPGFRPGGRPRSLLELQTADVPEPEWSGYMRGL